MKKRDDKYVHGQPCGCTHCESIRENWHFGPGLYKAIKRSESSGGGSQTTTWTLNGYVWGERITPGELIYVVRDLEPDEPGYDKWHPSSVLIVPLDGKPDRFARGFHLCTRKSWMEPA